MGVRFAGHRVCAVPLRRAAAGEAGEGEVEAVPVELDWTLLAVEAARELLEDLVYLHEHTPVSSDVVAVANAVEDVFVQLLLVAQVEGCGVYGDVYTESTQANDSLR